MRRYLFCLFFIVPGMACQPQSGDSDVVRQPQRTDRGLTLTFHGGVDHIGGSCTLVENGDQAFLVDLGSELDARNPNVVPDGVLKRASAIVLTHAHLDHSGLVPTMVREGFQGEIFATPETCAILPTMWNMAVRYERHPRRNFYGSRRSKVAHWRNDCEWGRKISKKNLWKEGISSQDLAASGRYRCKTCVGADVRDALRQLKSVPYGKPFSPTRGVTATFFDAGHILGSASVLIDDGQTKVVFSGDVGSGLHPFIADPSPPPAADVAVVESTYGNGIREAAGSSLGRFAKELGSELRAGRTVVIPAFVLDRTQKVISLIRLGQESGSIPSRTTVYVTSPSARELNSVYRSFLCGARKPISSAMRGPCFLNLPGLAEDAPDGLRAGAVHICAPSDGSSGSSRRLLRECLPDAQCTVLKVGWADGDSPVGRIITAAVDGKTAVQAWWDEPPIPLKATVREYRALSGHADADGLGEWCDSIDGLREVIVVHGTPPAREGLSDRLKSEGYSLTVPTTGQVWQPAANQPKGSSQPS